MIAGALRQQQIGAMRTFEAFHAIELGEQLVDDAVSDARGVVATPRRYRVKLVKEQDARRRRGRPPAREHIESHCMISRWSRA